MPIDTKRLCLELAQSETEKEAIDHLKKAGYWSDDACWQFYGGPENNNNFSTIGNQQSLAEVALVEKIINSIDAVLMRECLRAGIDPEDKKNAPQSIEEALKIFFHIFEGKLTNLDPSDRTKLAKNILLIATGAKSDPSYSIVDLGEGQTPARMPETLLSLNRSNKTRIPFVQGKFNMGSTGAFLFCGPFGGNNLQLIISRRDPKFAESKDSTSGKWGFTVIRRESPKEGFRSSTFKYLAPKGKILTLEADGGLPLLPQKYPKSHGDNMAWGTFIKLYEYQLTGYKTIAVFDLFYRLSLLLPSIALPISIFERRKGYTGHSLEKTLAGLSVRLEEDKRENLEPNFPSSSDMNVKGEEMKALVYAFKRGSKEKYAKKEGVVFTVNGQAHGFISRSLFERKSVGMAYLSDSILLLVDCSKFSARAREDLFMNSRDRLREGNPLYQEIEKQLEDLIKNHPGLRELREQRRREDIEDKLGNSKPLADAIEDILKKSPALSKLFLEGVRVLNPFKVKEAVSTGKFQSKKFPSYFKLKHEFPVDEPKLCPLNQKFRVQFVTDAENEYFDRDKDAGSAEIECGGHKVQDYSLNLWNGVGTLTLPLPENTQEGTVLTYQITVTDATQMNPFVSGFSVMVTGAHEGHSGGKGTRKGKGNKGNTHKSDSASYLNLPNIVEVRKGDHNWEQRAFAETSALAVVDSGENGYDFYVNMDNVYLQTELKGSARIEPKLLEARFKYGMVLVGISLVHYYEQEAERKSENGDGSFLERITAFTSAISPVLLPIINSLGDIDVD